jgi:excisionase family DNA binding protein
MVATIDRRLSRMEAARRLGVSVERVDRLARDGRLPFTMTALGKLYDPDAVQALAAERAQRSRPAPPDRPRAA